MPAKMSLTFTAQALFSCALFLMLRPCVSQLSQEYINIAKGKRITATATCGYDLPPGQETELFCKLATVPGKFGIKGLECDHCDRKVTGSVQGTKDHRIEYAIDGTERWWQSPPLSRGQQYNEVNITIDLGQEFHVAYVIVKTANSPRPGKWVLERSTDFGKTYTPWHYFAPSRSECVDSFGINPRIPLEQDNQILCSSEYSEVPPFENGEIHISLVNGRPSALKSQFSPKLQEWMRATNIRLRLLKVKTLYGEFLPLAEDDATVTRRFFYSIKDISIGASCICNGYADKCVPGSSPLSRVTCQCQNNTCGPSCSECCPGFVQYKWKSAYSGGIGCEACNCFGHSERCYYNENVDRANRSYNLAGELKGGGVCINCRDNTFGNNCQYCRHKFYNPTGVPRTSKDACVPCNCNEQFSTGRCYNGNGACECKPNYAGLKCDQCRQGYYGFPECKACQCNADGTVDGQCEAAGDQCSCKENYSGPKCDRCAPGYFRFPYCIKCRCDRNGALNDNCDVTTGQCRCKRYFQGINCNQCADGYFGYPSCRACSCDTRGVIGDVCDKRSGRCFCRAGFAKADCSGCARGYHNFPLCQACQCSGEGATEPDCDVDGKCTCKPRYAGDKCDRCGWGYYDFPRCIACACDKTGSKSVYCNPSSGQCPCKENFSGTFCNRCKPGFYGFPNCRQCSCNPAGVRPLPGRPLGDCSLSNTGQCECKSLVQGQDCSDCKPKSFNLSASNPRGCERCLCNVAGVIGGIELCDQVTGRCLCKTRVTSKRCEICKDGYYSLQQSNAFGCLGCDCDVGGSYSQICNKYSGRCKCRPNVEGRACDRPVTNYYHPSLYQILSEIEDGRTPENTSVRFRFDEKEFPGYSWRGYGVFSEIQPTVIVRVNAKWPENYHMVFHYVLNDTEDATGQVVVRHANGGKTVTQKSSVTFKPTVNGSSVTSRFALVAENGTATQFAMLKQWYDIEITTKSKKLLLDYVTIVPTFYPGPKGSEDQPQKKSEGVLKHIITRPCEVNGDAKLDDLCIQYSYIGVKKPGLVTIQAVEGYSSRGGGQRPTQVFSDKKVLKELDFDALALLNEKQNRLYLQKIQVPKSGKYVVVVQYFTTDPRSQVLDIYLQPSDRNSFSRFRLPSCKYPFGCRAVGLDYAGGVKVLNLKADVSHTLTAIRASRGHVAVDSFILVPYEKWSTDYIVPSKLCVTRMKVCTRTGYSMPEDAIMAEAGDKTQDQVSKKPPNIFDPNAVLVYVKGETTFEKSVVLPKPGEYAIIVHYYQPHHSTIHSDTTVSNTGSERGKTSFKYCPNTSGCRAVVKKLDGSSLFKLGTKAAVDFKIPKDKNLWIDYILFVPKTSYSPLLSSGEPVQRTKDFKDYCSKDNFHITNSSLPFCKKSVFSLTTFHNDGALACSCDTRGSRSERCEVFGGQCPCFDNVIGRTCTRCKTGYYGFPNCKKCSCDYCDPETGVCKCPPNTVGSDCSCVRGTFGYDPVLGCQQCRCDASGVTVVDGECDIATGQCPCLPSRDGRRCDRCKFGYYGYPNCKKCDCDPKGITGCDAKTGRCICKPHVAGLRCDRCRVGYFYLSQANPNGCLDCWCSGQTDRCIAVDSPVADAGVIPGTWTVNGAPSELSYSRTPTTATVTFPTSNVSSPLYWSLNMGDMTNAYGRHITISVKPGRASPEVPIAIIKSKGKNVIYKEKSLHPSRKQDIRISLTEQNWQNSDGTSLTRGDFMRALTQVDSFQLLASEIGVDGKVTFDLPVMSPLTSSQVEKCICPANTTGLSCQNCNSGYYRSGDSCVLCQCNGYSTTCDPVTGECKDCQHNTKGFNCETCVAGFYGSPTAGRVDACQRCPCPDSSIGKNFATSCFRRADGSFNCTCQTGYTGERCEECADGYFGDPLTVGCKPCQCNGNIDLNVKGNCDRKTGVCYRCVNNTAGDQCEKCQDGYYGDGRLNSCTRCDCNTCGSASSICDGSTGKCSCKIGVEGNRCTSCQVGTWDFDSCNGCKACACSESSRDNNCNPGTGQCNCKTGVTGLKCDRCQNGYFGLTENGCQACKCPSDKLCDINNGQCCDPSDSSCTFCPPYHIRTSSGCQYCGPCEERLFKRVDSLSVNFTSNSTGVANEGSRKRLDGINEDFKDLEKQVMNYNRSIADLTIVVDGTGIIAPPAARGSGAGPPEPPVEKKTMAKDVDDLNTRTEDIRRRTLELLLRAMAAESDARSTKDDAVDVEEKLKELLKETNDLLDNANTLLKSVSEGVSDITNVLTESRRILVIIKGRDYTELKTLVEKEQQLANNALKDSKNRMDNTTDLYNRILAFKPMFREHERTFENQIDESQSSLATSDKGEKLNNLAKTYNAEDAIKKAKAKKVVLDSRLQESSKILDEAIKILNSIKFKNSTTNSTVINEYLEHVDQRIANLTKEIEELQRLVNDATIHAGNLRNISDFLQSLLRDPQQFAEKALKAAEAYKNVVKAIEELLKFARQVEQNGKTALRLSTGLGLDAEGSKNTSSVLKDDAQEERQKIPGLEDRLNDLEDLIKKIIANFKEANETLMEVTKPFPKFDSLTKTLGERTKEVKTKAETARKDANEAKSRVDKIKIPDIYVLEEGYENISKILEATETLVNENKETLSRINKTVDEAIINQTLAEERIQTEVVDRIMRIRFNIERGRDKIRNLAGTAAKYQASTSAELKIPENAYGPSLRTKIDFYFQTKQQNARIMFLGSAEEYLAFQVKDGKLQVVFANGDERTTASQDDVTVNDGAWTKVTLSKTGANVQLSINDSAPSTKTLHSSSTTFTINPDNSYLFIGVPPTKFPLPDGLETTSLIGGVDQLYIDGRRVGLYDTKNYTSAPTELLPVTTKSEGFYFPPYKYFDGYLKVPSLKMSTTDSISFTINTAEMNGLVMFLVKDASYFVIEMINGTIGLRYNITGKGAGSGYTLERYNDDKDHKVLINFRRREPISLTVDGKSDVVKIPRHFRVFEFPRGYIGGIKRFSDASKGSYTDMIKTPGFIGCIKSVEHFGNKLDSRNWDNYHFESRCDVYKKHRASFSGDKASLEIDGGALNEDTDIGFAVKSVEPDALLMNLESEDGSFLSIGMKDGKITIEGLIGDEAFDVSETDPNRRRREAGRRTKLNDGKWHSIVVRRRNGVIQVLVDNVVVLTRKLKNPSVKFGKGKNVMRFGGVTDKSKSKSSLAKQLPSFKGQMKEPMLVESGAAKDVSFTDAEVKTGVSVGSRIVPGDQDIIVKPVTDVLPTSALPTTHINETKTPRSMTEATTEKPITTQPTTPEAVTPESPTPESTTQKLTTIGTTQQTTAQTTTLEPTTTQPTTLESTTQKPSAISTRQSPIPETTTHKSTTQTFTTKKTTIQTITTQRPTTQETTQSTSRIVTTVSTTQLLPESTSKKPDIIMNQTTIPTTPTTPTAPEPTPSKPPGCSSLPKDEYSDNTMAFLGNNGYALYKLTDKKFQVSGGLSFEFRTFASHGILFYAADNKGGGDFISCYLRDGKVYFAFNTGSGPLILHSNSIYNNGKWHQVTVYRKKVDANLTVAGRMWAGSGKTGATVINNLKYMYVGGYHKEAKNVPADARHSVSACIRRLKWHTGKDFGAPRRKKNVHACFKGGLEKSVYFSSKGGYLVADDKFSVLRSTTITLEIKPRDSTGLILAVVNEQKPDKGDYLVLELNSGSIVARVENGGGVVEVTWKPKEKEALCDNRWHSIQLIKFANSLNLKVDDDDNIPKTGRGSQNVANTNDPLYIGGLPADLKSAGIKVRKSFEGCMRNLKIKPGKRKQRISLSKPEKIVGKVSIYGCPKHRKK